ncbi:MAG: DUF1080 domain-containing protein [Planctomycetota bacterium]|nr:DUF1080 domain-containing protein [Planctomycetota bacterium]MDP6763761.1 DUF1080 domain-containing protein [Planctomycetota bacterium]MDP6990002.1 DUF1080 domain-containing protein [Planctomycetota bacterium]
MAIVEFFACLAPAAGCAQEPAYLVDHLATPEGEVIEVGGLAFLSDATLLVSTRRGRIWRVAHALDPDPAAARFELWAEGLQEGLGLAVVDDEVYVLQRGELSRISDADGDGRADTVETISAAWGLSGNYHEFAFGLPRDDAGDFYAALNVGFFDTAWWHGQSKASYRGWALRIAPDGTTTPVASGFRSPCGLGRNGAGDVFVTDNQGDWIPVCPIYHLVEGRFYGHPASLVWTDAYREAGVAPSDTNPVALERAPAAVWLPYKWSRSTGNLVHDGTGGRFGPFGDQLFVSELTNGRVLRVQLEKVRGEYQGACFRFADRVGSVCRVAFAPDGTLFCGLTNRGWGGLSPSHGIARVRWSGAVPMEMERVHLLQEGFEVTFTRPVATEIAPEQVTLTQYDYDYWWEYGSPERGTTTVEVLATALSPDRRTLTIDTAGLTPAMCARCVLSGVESDAGAPLAHAEFNYTINQLPEGERTSDHVAKVVPPPPGREADGQGWLQLSYGDALDVFEAEGWRVCEPIAEPELRGAFRIEEGDSAVVNVGEHAAELSSETLFGDCEVELHFMLPPGGNSGVYLQGRYEVQLIDSTGVADPGPGDCGGIYAGPGWEGSPPDSNAFAGPGIWHKLTIEFIAPRFDGAGRKVQDARIEEVWIDGVLVQEGIELPGPTFGGWEGEVPLGPLRIQGDHTQVALRGIKVKPVRPRWDPEGWEVLFDGSSIDGWHDLDDGFWEVDEDGILVGEGGRSHLFSPRGDYTDFEARARLKISDGGNSGFYFRATLEKGWPAGYEAQVNSTYPDPQKTGSLYSIAPIRAHLVAADTWFDYGVRCEDTEEGAHIRITINGAVVCDVVDRERRHGSGHFAIQQHHEGSVIAVRRIEVREL